MHEKRTLIKKYKEYKCYGWIVAMLAAGGAVGLIVCGVVIVKPVVETKSLEFQQTTCTTTRSYLTGQQIGCSCGKNCNSEYPCLRVTVTYVMGGMNATVNNAVLFDTEQRLNSDGDNAEAWQCVTAPCESNRGNNRESVLSFNSTYGPGKNYSCLYHPDAPTKVLLKRLFTWDDMFHSMLWSAVGFVIFTAILFYIFGECKKIKDQMSSIQVAPPPAGAPMAQPAQPGHFLPPPPAYPGVGQQDQALQMHPAPPKQDLYNTQYSSGFTYN